MESPKYLVDTSTIMCRQPKEDYEYKAFPTHWFNFDKLIENGKLISLDKVRDEILEKTEDNFYVKWVDKYEYMFKQSIDSDVSSCLNELSLKFPDWYNVNDEKADKYLIAYAKVKGLVLVTQEKYNYNGDANHKTKERNFKIPTLSDFIGAKCVMNSCSKIYDYNKDYDFECISFNELVKRELLYKP